jgi:hypothetical protein
MATGGQISCPPAGNFLSVSGQFPLSADMQARALALDCLRHHHGNALAVAVTEEGVHEAGRWLIEMKDLDGTANYSVEP